MTKYVTETLSPGLTRTWTIHDIVYETTTAYQHVLIADTQHGRTLFCGDAGALERQSSVLSQLVYHESLMVPPLALAPALDRVLIIGSSEGVASQIALDAGAARVDHVDVDLECVRACAEHLPYGYIPGDVDAALAGQAAGGRLRLYAEDGHAFVQDRLDEGTRYDAIIIDLPDEASESDAQHNRLYELSFLTRCTELLSAGGVISTQAGCPTLWRQDSLRQALARFTTAFPSMLCYSSWEHEWAFLTGSAQAADSPLSTLLQRRLPALPYRPQTMDAVSAASATILPYHLRSAVAPSDGQEPR
ncbi:spermidine synthase [Nonomuraea aridisoli]|uniref:Polyamine aminopropyltransferase n=1 Tax=Nonomuraea aridisoli TaxID=2070368 RepID=A0A2W2E6N9_9ACTN|nr:spermidine synthase [Nonomuraea aridisoli]PZG18041.1 spermidine synthase [Nonomuraea aridisoli]